MFLFVCLFAFSFVRSLVCLFLRLLSYSFCFVLLCLCLFGVLVFTSSLFVCFIIMVVVFVGCLSICLLTGMLMCLFVYLFVCLFASLFPCCCFFSNFAIIIAHRHVLTSSTAPAITNNVSSKTALSCDECAGYDGRRLP